ncbi:hypothetical protein [Rufibacter sp. LB8]|uniref:hypothetical protein n=1 Tax=Rufibacter sp. LB8 TaxID=2777781 RepID=UPI00178C729D|nr:hypothetical protein [Rufibacter sp. LB8]
MTTTKNLLLWLAFLCVFTACSDKEEDPAPEETTTAAAGLDYFPTTAGSTWSYEGDLTYSYKSLGTKKVINGKSYTEFEQNQNGTISTIYVFKEAGSYTLYTAVAGVGNIELTVLKENEPEGGSWSTTTVINGLTTRYTYTLVKKGLTKTVLGKEYKNVIQVKLATVVLFQGMEIPFDQPFNYYFAKGVGQIMSELGSSGTVSLKSYTIK